MTRLRPLNRLAVASVGYARSLTARIWRELGRRNADLQWLHHNLAYCGSQDDLFIVTYPKSGSTLVQMLVYQLLTDGNLNLPHIDAFCPYLERHVMSMLEKGFNLSSMPSPRILKSHLPYSRIPKGPGRYIYVMRSGLDVVVSYYYHCVRYANYRAPFEAFVDDFLAGKYGSWFAHVEGWSKNSARLNVLYVTYEDLRQDFRRTAQRVADFCDVQVAEPDWARIVENCSFETMRRHEEKFDPLRIAPPTPAGPTIDSEDRHFIRRGRIGQGQAMLDSTMLRAFEKHADRHLRGAGAPASQLRQVVLAAASAEA
jgi:sulfotransferase family protein